MNKTIHIKRTIDIEITVPTNETQQETEQWIDCNFRADISWPESQELSEYEGFYENCDFISGDTIEPCSYLVNKNWYGRLKSGELKKTEEYAA